MKTPNPDDLLILARRRKLSASEARQLQMLTDASPEAQLLLEAGKGFDAAGEPLPGDGKLADRLVDRTLKLRGEKSRRSVLRAVLLASVVSGAASAAVGVAIVTLPAHSESVASKESKESRDAPTGAAHRSPAGRLGSSTNSGAPSATPSVAAEALVAPQPDFRPHPSFSGSSRSFPSAAQAYADANTLRRGRKTLEAISAYRGLIARHPGTAEARQSTIALGNLLLETGRAAQALDAYKAYGKGPLDEEAAWGQIRALLALGRSTEAREVTALLEAAHPASPYVVAARRRLAQTVGTGSAVLPSLDSQ